jgi:hypothetical protein
MYTVKAPRFSIGDLVFNRITNEHGKIRRVYQKKKEVMYQVSVPADRESWNLGGYPSDWEEDRLELSSNEHLK